MSAHRGLREREINHRYFFKLKSFMSYIWSFSCTLREAFMKFENIWVHCYHFIFILPFCSYCHYYLWNYLWKSIQLLQFCCTSFFSSEKQIMWWVQNTSKTLSDILLVIFPLKYVGSSRVTKNWKFSPVG